MNIRISIKARMSNNNDNCANDADNDADVEDAAAAADDDGDLIFFKDFYNLAFFVTNKHFSVER